MRQKTVRSKSNEDLKAFFKTMNQGNLLIRRIEISTHLPKLCKYYSSPKFQRHFATIGTKISSMFPSKNMNSPIFLTTMKLLQFFRRIKKKCLIY